MYSYSNITLVYTVPEVDRSSHICANWQHFSSNLYVFNSSRYALTADRPNVFVSINSCVHYTRTICTHTRLSVWHQLHAAPQHASTVEALESNDNVQCVPVAVAVADCTHSYSRFIARFVLMWTGLNWTGV